MKGNRLFPQFAPHGFRKERFNGLWGRAFSCLSLSRKDKIRHPRLNRILQSINDLIEENNERSKSLAQDQRNARRALRLHEIASLYC